MKTFPASFAAVFLVSILLSSCMFVPPPARPTDDKFGSEPSDVGRDVKAYFSTKLKDPYSAVYESIEKPSKGWRRDGAIDGGAIHYGFLVAVRVNAKNSYGGYIGAENYLLFIDAFSLHISDVTYLPQAGMTGRF